jgi:hypothetical protein
MLLVRGAWTNSKDMRHGPAAWTFNVDRQDGQAASTGSMNMEHIDMHHGDMKKQDGGMNM